MMFTTQFAVFLAVYLTLPHFKSSNTVLGVQQRQQPQNRRTFFPSHREGNKFNVAVEAATAVDATVPSLQQQDVAVADDSSIDEKTSIVDRIEKRNESATEEKLQRSNGTSDEKERAHLRPAYVRDLLLQHETYLAQINQTESAASDFPPPPIIYYFGIGSNMLRSKLENRGNGFGGSNMTTTNVTATNSTESTNITNKIDIISMEPAYIKNYRLSFNLRGFCPLEPGMGSLDPIDDDSSSKPLHAYEEPECHGALIALTLDNYERVMRSEGVGPNVTNPSYEEIVITAIPYNTSRAPVTAVALRARPHVRLRQDPSPSQRYMDILRQGAAELQLRSNYQTFLKTHPVQETPSWLQRIAVYNLICTMTISSKLKWRGLSKLQSFLLYKVYIPCGLPQVTRWQRRLSNLCMGGILFPGACFGRILQWYCTLFKKTHSPMMQRFISMMDMNYKNQTSDDVTAKQSPANAVSK